MVPPPDYTRGVARAGWSIAAAKQYDSILPPPELEVVGAALVQEVATSWTRKYQLTIVRLGFDNESSFHYECMFSRPTNELPVPSFVLSTKFALVVPGEGKDPRLLYSFEESDLRHEWALVRDENGQFRAAPGQQFSSLGLGRFEMYMDNMMCEKETVRNAGVDLITDFEATRVTKPPAYSEDDSEGSGSEASDDSQENMCEEFRTAAAHMRVSLSDAQGEVAAAAVGLMKEEDQQDMTLAMREALQAAGLYCDKVEPPSSLAELLANIFDAADEENAGELPHYEVARLLSGTLPGFGLELWDIYLLMTSAQENDDGFIECKPFIQAAPEIIQALRKRRMSYRSRGLPGVEIPLEAVKHCFSDEVHVTAVQLIKVFEQCSTEDPTCGRWSEAPHRSTSSKQHSSKQHHSSQPHSPHSPVPQINAAGGAPAAGSHGGRRASYREPTESMEPVMVGIKRRFCQDCLAALPERLSPQESMRLLQMLPEDEDGFILIDELPDHLEHLRTEAMLNALVESDVLSLRTHLVLRFRHLGLEADGKMRLWIIKQALLQADQVCLTRLQIHVLLCLAEADVFGYVDIATFLGMCCVVIPHMFDARLFVETAERLIQEHAEAMRRSENEEMAAALGAARVGTIGGQDDENSQEKVEVDSDTVEKILQQVITLNDDAHRTPPSLPAETIFNILQSNEREVQSTQLSTFELTGLLAEMQSDADGNVFYVDHIKKWVPIIFEQRKNSLLGRYLEECSAETLGFEMPDLAKLEAMFPLLPASSMAAKPRGSQRRSSRVREHKDFFTDSRRHTVNSNPPSYRRSGVSGTETVNSKERQPGQVRSKGRVSTSRRLSSSEAAAPPAVKEPPAGRGYARRKARMEAQAAEPPVAPGSPDRAKP